ncbi:MAG: D-glycerate dehydrogenase [Pseudomonadota bacterium]
MARQRLKVLVTTKLPRKVEARMMELFDCTLARGDHSMDPAELAAAIRECDVLVPTVTDRIDASLIAQAQPRLKLIASFSTGVDHIDLAAARQAGIMVTNTANVLSEDTADMAMALIMAVPRRLGEGERMVRAGRWRRWQLTSMLGQRIWGKKLGIIGMGRIGLAVARRARGFGLSIHYHNRNRVAKAEEDALEAQWWGDLDQMLSRVDFVSLHCPHTPATHHLLDARRIALMRRDAILINTSRGGLIDEQALIAALQSGHLAGAGLDVYESEPVIDPAWLAMENVILLPHMSSATIEGREEMGERVLINIQTFADGHRPPDRIIPDPG